MLEKLVEYWEDWIISQVVVKKVQGRKVVKIKKM